MAKPTGFLEIPRAAPPYRPIAERIGDFREVELPLLEPQVRQQATRCMDCGVPTCHALGCPVQNRIPEFNELVRLGRWREASANLHATNNFPEFTGRTCPAPCEPACTLAINSAPVTIRHIESQIVERAWREGWVIPQPPPHETGRRVAVVGSGPAGLAAAQQLRRAGHRVVVFERDDRLGGLLRYGIPDFKLEKWVIDRRLEQLVAEGVEFQCGVAIGVDLSAAYLQKMFDAVLLCTGASVPRELDVPGRTGARNVVQALDYLTQQNRVLAGQTIAPDQRVDAAGKVVAVIGGGDTGSDCVGTAIRQGARQVLQLNYHDAPPARSDPLTTWPLWPPVLHTSSSHEEGCDRRWNLDTVGLERTGDDVHALRCVRTTWEPGPDGGRPRKVPVPGSEHTVPVDLVLLACGFKHPEHGPLVEQLRPTLDPRGRFAVTRYQTSTPGIFAAGDCVVGASLVVTAINAGREAAAQIDAWLGGRHRAAVERGAPEEVSRGAAIGVRAP